MALVLVITSKLGLANAVETALLGAGYQTIVASSAKQAIDLLAGEVPSLILLGETNQSLFKETAQLKSHLSTNQVPIMLQSSDYSVHSLAYQKRLGVQAALSNPYTTTQLLRTIKEWVPAVS